MGICLSVKQKGFTLIEILVVVAIIGVLSSVTLSSLSQARMKADDSKRAQEIGQLKVALELYALSNNSYPTLAHADSDNDFFVLSDLQYKEEKDFISTLLPVRKAYAQGVNAGCDNFTQIMTKLVNSGHIKTIPKDPKHSPSSGVCYKGWSDGSNVAIYTYLNEKYSTNPNLNKKVGLILNRNSEITTSLAQSICNSVSSANGDPFPVMKPSGSGGYCSGTFIADKAIGITSGAEVLDGGGVVTGEGSCSNPAYTSQSSCEQDRSYCSNSNFDTQESCESAECTTPAHCSEGDYSDPQSCMDAMCDVDSSCSDPAYTNQASCEGAMCGGNYVCSESGYEDQSSCENAVCGTYYECSDPSYGDEGDCTGNGHSWYETGGYGCGYTWDATEVVNCGHTWTDAGSQSCNYQWIDETPGGSCNYNWNSVPPAIWTP